MTYSTPWKDRNGTTATLDGTSCLVQEPADDYHAQAKDYLSSHQLADFRKSPLLYHRKRCGLVPDIDRPAYLLGRAAHTLILEGCERFDEEYAVGGPINQKTGKVYGPNTKAFAEWATGQGKPVVTEEQFDLLLQMQWGVEQNELALSLLAEGVAEGVGRTEYCGVECQIRIDWLNPARGLVDLKTCDELTWFESDARRYGYAHQLSFYRAVLAQLTGQVAPVHLVAVEKREPFRCGVWEVAGEVLDVAQRENEAAIERLKACVASDEWPTGYEELRVFDSI